MTLSVPDNIRTALRTLLAAGREANLVGGCVRDSLLGLAPSDWDICTDAAPKETEACFAGHRVIETGLRHGTVTVLCGGEPVEITTYRTDGSYSDGRRPDSVVFVKSLTEDLARRDFTINAMAWSPVTGLSDPFGGREDLRDGIIRCVGVPEDRFREDSLRILRALRFAGRFGFAIEEKTAAAMLACREGLKNVAPERILAELRGILAAPRLSELLLGYREIFFEILPELRPLDGFDQRNRHHIHDIYTHTALAAEDVPADFALRLTMLLHDIGKPDCFTTDGNGVGHFYGHAERGAAMADLALRRLRADNALREEVTGLIKRHAMTPPQTKKGTRRLAAALGYEGLRRLILCWKADSADRAPEIRAENLAFIEPAGRFLDELEREEERFTPQRLAVNGRDLLALGFEPGPALGAALAALYERVLDETLPNERDVLLDAARALRE